MRHGTRYGYRTGCRCDGCVSIEAAYQRAYYEEWRHARRIGRYSVAPAIVHVDACRAAGMSIEQIAAAAGVAASTVRRVVTFGGTARAATLRKVLAVRPPRRPTAIGLTRRVQALSSLGWTAQQIADAAGLNRQTVGALRRGDNTQPKPRAVEGVLRAYSALSMRTPTPATEREALHVRASRMRAERSGWAPPLAWDDDTIDNPGALPVGAGWGKGPANLAEFEFLIDSGESADAAIRRMGTSPASIERAAERKGRLDLAALARAVHNAQRREDAA